MKRRVLVAALAVAAFLIGWLLWHTPAESPAAPGSTVSASPGSAASPKPGSAAAGTAEVSPLADALNGPQGDIRRDLQIVAELLDAFRSNLPREGNPVGLNAEITAALAGRNRLKLALIAPSHPAINRGGELCDRWGSPFFFHAESATRMEIRSAGPDRRLWTEDDAVLTP